MTISIYTDSDLSAEDVLELEDFDGMLHEGSKRASFGRVGRMARNATENTAAQLIAGTLGTATVVGGKAMYDKATYGRDLRAITDVYPHLKKYPEKELRLAYSSLRNLNPQFAKDPLVGGTLLGQLLRQRDPLNPKALRLDPGMASDLVRNRRDTRGGIDEMVPAAFQAGMQGAMDYEGVLGDRAFKREMAAADRSFKRETQTGDHRFKRELQTGDQTFRHDEALKDRTLRTSQSAADRAQRGKHHTEQIEARRGEERRRTSRERSKGVRERIERLTAEATRRKHDKTLQQQKDDAAMGREQYKVLNNPLSRKSRRAQRRRGLLAAYSAEPSQSSTADYSVRGLARGVGSRIDSSTGSGPDSDPSTRRGYHHPGSRK